MKENQNASVARMATTLALISDQSNEAEIKQMAHRSLSIYFENKTSIVSKENPVIAWWSGGADSAVTCWLCLQWFGKDCVRVVSIDTFNEDDDTYRFKRDCEKWWGVEIETISSNKWDGVEDVWEHYLSLNVANGAICSSSLKREVRQDFQKKNNYSYQAFGFDADEIGRARNMKDNYPHSRPIFPLITELIKKGEALSILQKNGVEPPNSYKMGYGNNNCLKTGCVQGGAGYWQKFQKDFPDRFDAMAAREHLYTDLKGKPVTVIRRKFKGKGAEPVFLKPHSQYPNAKTLSDIKGREPKALMECNGFCGPKPKLDNHE